MIETEDKTYSMMETSKLTELPYGFLKQAVFDGRIELTSGQRVPHEVIDTVLKQKEDYIGLVEVINICSDGRVDGMKVVNRRRLIDFFEKNEYFGLKHIPYDELFLKQEFETLFFERKDAMLLQEYCRGFFEVYDMSEEEKIQYYIENSDSDEALKEIIRKYVEDKATNKKITESTTDFVKNALDFKSIEAITNDNISVVLSNLKTVRAKQELTRWLSNIPKFYNTNYEKVTFTSKNNGSKTVSAYDFETYTQLAVCIFNAEYIYEHKMIEKALDKSKYAEMWLYIALFFVCGWRAYDVCMGWKYLNLRDREDSILGINKDTLYEDILNDNIPDETYEQVCEYCLESVNISGQLPTKTSRYKGTTLMVVITPELYTFFGLLILIAESHNLRDGSGYMDSKRRDEYQYIYNMKQFFGPKIAGVLNNENLRTRSLNKTYLQSLEQTGRQKGYGSIHTAMMASLARNHTNFNSITAYLKDFSYTQEDAETVLYFIAQRGVFAFDLYQACITAFGDRMNELSMKKQTELMQKIDVSPLVVEQNVSEEFVKAQIQDLFVHGEKDLVNNMLKTMYEISQMHGKAKDTGTYCTRRARGEACVNPECESCIACGCKYLVISKLGYMPMLEKLHDYYEKGVSGDKRAFAIFKKELMPRFQTIINRLIKENKFNNDDKQGINVLIKEVFSNGECTTGNADR